MNTWKLLLGVLLLFQLTACRSSGSGSGLNDEDKYRHRGGHTGMFKYNELMIKDYDEMLQMVQTLVKQSRQVGSQYSDTADDAEAIAKLREAMKLILSRPNSDNMIAKLTPEVRRDLTGYGAYEDTMSILSVEGLDYIRNDKASVNSRATAVFLLENILSEVKPEAADNPEMRRIVQRIADAHISIPNDVRNDMKLGGMYNTQNPSDIAAGILKKLPKQEKKKVKKGAKPKADEQE